MHAYRLVISVLDEGTGQESFTISVIDRQDIGSKHSIRDEPKKKKKKARDSKKKKLDDSGNSKTKTKTKTKTQPRSPGEVNVGAAVKNVVKSAVTGSE